MRESFSEYKRTLDINLVNIPFIYAGDVINSVQKNYKKVKNTPLTSHSFIIDCLVYIYNISFEEMKIRSKEVILPEEVLFNTGKITDNLLSKLNQLNVKHNYIFTTGKNSILFGNIKSNNNKYFPHYFYESKKISSLNIDILLSPLIDECDLETVLFTTDRPIQSLIYTLQNMDYKITPCPDNIGKDPHLMEWTHEITYPFYNCDYESYKIVIKNISECRNEKINKILNDN